MIRRSLALFLAAAVLALGCLAAELYARFRVSKALQLADLADQRVLSESYYTLQISLERGDIDWTIEVLRRSREAARERIRSLKNRS